MPIPRPFAAEYRVATDHEIRSWSFGQITKPRVRSSAPLEDHIGTLTDQRIFGPCTDYRCACGKYDGAKNDGMVCDRCGVKVTTTDARRARFGHIEFLSGPVEHPFDSSVNMGCYPVIPAVYLESRSGAELCLHYEQLLTGPAALIPLIENLIPAAEHAIQWQTSDSDIFTRGMGLIRYSDAT
ncbi:MAG: hypothetical protein ABGZ17_25335 [Planctomycetaceae bacterium]